MQMRYLLPLFWGLLLGVMTVAGLSISRSGGEGRLVPIDSLTAVPAQAEEEVDPCSIKRPVGRPPRIRLTRLGGRFDNPVYLTHAGDGSGRLFVVEQRGVIRVMDQAGNLSPTPFLDIRTKVRFGGERGLLSVAFHPDFARNGRFFVNYTRAPDGATVVEEYRLNPRSGQVDKKRARVIITISQPYANHNGGQLQFGPDGMLYIGMGDGGAAGDPLGSGQNLTTLLGKMLRIDVDSRRPYAIPADNPFAKKSGARGEIWAYGLRNPWRFSFDRCTGKLYAADVGQDNWEEINLIVRGGNYGWNIMEGNHCFKPPQGCKREGLIRPIAEYSHKLGCSITGGYVYRGRRIPSLIGRYLFGDFCSGKIWTITPPQHGKGNWKMDLIAETDLRISSFGEDEAGELYVLDLDGGVYRIDPPE